MRLAPLPFLFLLAAACGTDTGDDTNGNGGNDSGDTGDVDLGPAGCINLNGEEGDFANISDAMVYAKDGDTVNVCAGEYADPAEDGIVVPPGVHVVGAGSETTSVDAPSNAPAFALSGSGSSVSGFSITSTRSGVKVDGAADVTLSDLFFDSVANYGVEATDATNLTVSTCTFYVPAYGGVFVSGGSAVIDAGLFTEPTGYGVQALGDAEITVSNSIFDQVHATTNDGTDGHAIYGSSATVTTDHNVITTDDLFAVWVESGTLTMTGDLIADTPYGVVAFDTALTTNGVDIFGSTEQGMFINTSTPVSLTDTTVALNGGNTTGLTSCYIPYDDFGTAGYVCGGILLITDEATLTGVSVSDYEQYGLYAVPSKKTQALTLTNSTFDNNGRWSVYGNTVNATVDGLIVTNHREPDETNTDPCYGYVDRGDAVVFESSEATVTNSTIADGEGWGLVFVLGSGTVTNSTISGHECSGMMGYEGTLIASGNTFTGAKSYGAIYNYQGSIVLDGNTFADNAYSTEYSYDDGAGGSYRYTYTGGGRDVISYTATGCSITNNTFTGGDLSLDIEVSGCDIGYNTWTDYDGALVQANQNEKSDPVELHDSTIDDVAGPVVYAVYGYADAHDLTIGTTRTYPYSYEQYHTDVDGVETLSYSYSYDSTQPVFYGYGYYYAYWSDNDGDGVYETPTEYGYQAALKLSHISVGSAISTLVQGYESSLEISDLTVESVAGYGIYGNWNHYAPQVEIDGVTVQSSDSAAIYLDGNTVDAGYALLSDVTVEASSGDAVNVTGIADVEITGLDVLSTSGYGLWLDGSYAYTDYSVYPSVYVSGTLDYLGVFADINVNSALRDGVAITNGVVDIEGVEADGGAGSGLALSSTNATVIDNVFDSNASYGMSCSSVTLAACSGNILTNNGLGAHLDCSDDCAL